MGMHHPLQQGHGEIFLLPREGDALVLRAPGWDAGLGSTLRLATGFLCDRGTSHLPALGGARMPEG